MADGAEKPIEDIQPGDVVLATDPQTGLTVPEPVIDTISGTGDKTLVEVTVTDLGERAVIGTIPSWAAGHDGGNLTATFTATDNHPVWVDNQATWVDAGDLQPGDRLLTPNDIHVSVTSVQPYTDTLTVYNFTVADVHTYYVIAGNTPVLVHNTNVCGVHRWTSQSNLDDHFASHGAEMGFSTQAEYRYAAEDLMCMCGARRPGVQIRQNGSTRYFLDPKTGEFGIASGRGIVTYFIPENPRAHFNNQPGTLIP